ncbi:MAG: type II secretion system F family protein [Bacteroidetes bacterium HGW-Bacteroidetes-21]|jgi:type IV pilus assembly protein PilC|nr:MAG: type II secretion system F family protein [Bacteroidetes bacterium HGW-Bacteroidetes-21]
MSIDISNHKHQNPKVKENVPKGSALNDFFSKDIQLFGKKLKDKKKENFFSELGTLLSSGIDIKTALELIIEEQKKKSDIQLFDSIYKKVIEGKSLSEAMKESGHFSIYEHFSIKIGEESGQLHEVLEALSEFLSKKVKQRRQIVNSFTYPIMVLIIAVVAVFFMMNFVVPMFVDVFKRFNGKLPKLTQVIIDISQSFSENVPWILLFIVAISLIVFIQRKKDWYRKLIGKIILKTPFLGSIIQKIYISRFCQAMSMLMSAHTPMLKSIELVQNMIGFYPFEKALEKIRHDIMKGALLYESMSKFPIFEKRVISLVRVGEEVNQLDAIFTRLNKHYSEELEYKIGILSSLLEPILIIFVGILVGVILVAMYLPLFSISTNIYG